MIYDSGMMVALLWGAILGFISAVPVSGPISAIVFSRGMRAQYSHGRWIALGAGLIEGGYTFLAFWGFNHFLSNLSFIFQLSNAFAALLLLVLGVYFFRSKKMREPLSDPDEAPASAHEPVIAHESIPHEKRSILLGASMSALNPSLIATWTVAITSLSSLHFFKFTLLNSTLFSLGVSAGIITWFTIMLKLLERHRHRLSEKIIDYSLKGIGLMLSGFSAMMIFNLICNLKNSVTL